MTVNTQASGYIGLAFETVYGTYVAPTRFFPIKSESLVEDRQNQNRRLIRGIADTLGSLSGFFSVAGDIEMELMEDIVPYFLYVSRNSIVKSGTGPNLVYTTTPTHVGNSVSLTKPSMSITVVKNGLAFGFVGCVTSALEFSASEGIPSFKVSIIGSSEASQSLPTPAYLATDLPFTAGMYNIKVPAASGILYDVESFTLTINDNAEPMFRHSDKAGAQWVKFGEREVTFEMSRDFDTRAEYDSFKALTTVATSLLLTRNANRSVEIKLPNAVRSTYEIDGLSDQAAPILANVSYMGHYDPTTSKSYEIVCKALTDIT
jgi:hypothetical protein